MSSYPWAANVLKLQRAIGKATREGAQKNEERIQEIYLSYGGKLVDLSESKDKIHMSEEEEKVGSNPEAEAPKEAESAPDSESAPETAAPTESTDDATA